ncbi:hypothetical protein SISNIDRAFT_486284 [Sistotremastrum niveocremeum HHB9708]|uniref:Uncharacterized protein n=1 Tax=Sistotremastrum niveocremeum HHB9708 TaxID=1314777 RepID=A0A164TZT9_9AGAM|nr:hypothetical protein SISNIDRAFT_486284 [Sistotremastrum niveocremeum HHB9708]
MTSLPTTQLPVPLEQPEVTQEAVDLAGPPTSSQMVPMSVRAPVQAPASASAISLSNEMPLETEVGVPLSPEQFAHLLYIERNARSSELDESIPIHAFTFVESVPRRSHRRAVLPSHQGEAYDKDSIPFHLLEVFICTFIHVVIYYRAPDAEDGQFAKFSKFCMALGPMLSVAGILIERFCDAGPPRPPRTAEDEIRDLLYRRGPSSQPRNAPDVNPLSLHIRVTLPFILFSSGIVASLVGLVFRYLALSYIAAAFILAVITTGHSAVLLEIPQRLHFALPLAHITMGFANESSQSSMQHHTSETTAGKSGFVSLKNLILLPNRRLKVTYNVHKGPNDEWTEEEDSRYETYDAYLSIPSPEDSENTDDVESSPTYVEIEEQYPTHRMSASQEHIIQPALLHILIFMPLFVLNQQCLDLSAYTDHRLFPCSMIMGPLITASASLLHYLSKISIEPTSRRNFLEERSRYQFSTTLSWAFMGLGYIYASAAVAQSSFVTSNWPVSVVATGLLPLLLFYWMYEDLVYVR